MEKLLFMNLQILLMVSIELEVLFAYEELNNTTFAEFVVFKDLDLEREEQVFNTINTTQKGVPPSLAANIQKKNGKIELQLC